MYKSFETDVFQQGPLVDGKDHTLTWREKAALHDIAVGQPNKGNRPNVQYFYSRYGQSATNKALLRLHGGRRSTEHTEHKKQHVWNTAYNTLFPPLDVLARRQEEHNRERTSSTRETLAALTSTWDIHGSASARDHMQYAGFRSLNNSFGTHSTVHPRALRVGRSFSECYLAGAQAYTGMTRSDLLDWGNNSVSARNQQARLARQFGAGPIPPIPQRERIP